MAHFCLVHNLCYKVQKLVLSWAFLSKSTRSSIFQISSSCPNQSLVEIMKVEWETKMKLRLKQMEIFDICVLTMINFVFLFPSPLSIWLHRALGLWYMVQRSKQCTDFAFTVHFLHFLICWIYNRQFPHTVSWWLVNIVCIALMTVLGEFLCMRTELKAIPVSQAIKHADLWRLFWWNLWESTLNYHAWQMQQRVTETHILESVLTVILD